ncbi:hypothetical protein HF521_016819 [Silurus meridionalis]|uniref:Uncharacterized protein n=1 Tax=Silurus meridionalis TaxID=175797 RepID=A0A8T0BSA7_SILME|nr:hypothetical protein HF521_016819 [Silurus meridionalis]
MSCLGDVVPVPLRHLSSRSGDNSSDPSDILTPAGRVKESYGEWNNNLSSIQGSDTTSDRYGNCSQADSPAEPEEEEMQRRENIKKRVMIEIKLQDEGQQTEGHKEPSEMDEQYH